MNGNERGTYLTESRAEALERRLTELETRLTARDDELERRIAEVAKDVWEPVRVQIQSMVSLLRDRAASR